MIKDKAAAKPVIDTVAAQLISTRASLGRTTTSDDVEYFKKRMAGNRLDLETYGREQPAGTGAPSPTKAVRIYNFFLQNA